MAKALDNNFELFSPETLVDIFLSLHSNYSGYPDTVVTAFEIAREAHGSQYRKSGEPYFFHPLSVAEIVASLGADEVTISAALLHDAVEDTELTLAEVEERFGSVVAQIVDGVTKLDRLSFESKEAQQAATMRKMLLAMARDPRVLVIKLADRLHNMRTIGALPYWKQRRTAQETMDIYAPLAHRLGIAEIKWQLEDLAFATLHPRRFAEIEHLVTTKSPERQEYLNSVIEVARERLREVGIDAEVTGRPKHLWSIYEKMVVKEKDFDSIYDIVGMRIITETEKDCWAALGVVHSIWSPVPGRFKDYVNAPKFNLYQSLHTTVVLPSGNPLEVQLRTKDMHLRAEYGVAAHWGYKEGSTKEELLWLQRIVDWQKDTTDPHEFLENLKLDLEVDEVYVFTPKGRVITLPANATPIDFAYAVHTEVGHRCIGAKVNQRLVPLDSRLSSGDTVEIFTSKVQSAGPSRDWLKVVVTPRARNKIRQWFSKERRDEAVDEGREELIKALRKEGLPLQKHTSQSGLMQISQLMGFDSPETLLAAIGENHISARTVVAKMLRDLYQVEEESSIPVVSTGRKRRRREGPGIYVEGLDDVMVKLSKCCSPMPGDEIIGFVTRGKGVSVHRSDCSNAMALFSSEAERMIDVEWDLQSHGIFSTTIEVRSLDRSRLLADVARVLSEHHVNILNSSSQAGHDRVSTMRFEFELADPAHLDSILASLRQLEGVYNAYRVLPKGGGVVLDSPEAQQPKATKVEAK
ncbi:GTP pyrophosphokinase [Ferrithrix thermotolerans DSM 19514]|jgi:guanosine-3',5'-bis(diphosphate) 3'-pyrophosphohydrolase|uniref:GTP pyrophosphokinase n=1 Tax=Ferrithrix thermotolerans DSM 19514 TaxID=1121881 RepID=A0A1M4SHN1_9ACTN|nr:bifunctional (p)ppGpp synthetase/guanosine-3',5'-bis(diphosphate) 3'-pyrophosphohydrolase [Ferrithrix thermotolerans]SHE31662.1 GTP pyrophosphokinase [Ferrithrix thermotolerans DSM 19514]